VSALQPDDFRELHRKMMEKTKGSPTVGRFYVTVARMPWAWGKANAKCEAVAMGSRFKLPPKSAVRIKRRERGRQTFTTDEIKTMLDDSRPFMRAAILLGINGGYTQSEVAEIQRSWLDLEYGAIDHLRGKTAFDRRVTLWPETIEAIKAMPKYQPRERKAKGRLFMTRNGRAYSDDGANGIAQAFKRLMKKHKIQLEQTGFGKLRATHRTVSDEAKDPNACRLIVGHQIGEGSEENYIRSISDDRLKAVTDHVHDWLFGSK
jgi:integrase